MLLHKEAELKKPDSVAARVFRLRFRVTYPLFEMYVSWAQAKLDKDGKGRTDASGREGPPLQLQVTSLLSLSLLPCTK